MDNDNNFLEKLSEDHGKRKQRFPGKSDCQAFIEQLFSVLFLCNPSSVSDKEKLIENYGQLQNNFKSLLNTYLNDFATADHLTSSFFHQLPAIYNSLLADAEAILATDPAAHNIEEVFVAYPGFFATFVYRMSNIFYQESLFTLARFFSEYAHSKTGIDIHPGAMIGHSFVIDHGTGIVVGETTIIGNNVKLYQGVTLGALNVSKATASIKRHPTIEDNVVIYAGATILGGTTVIGNGSIIGGNVWLTYSVPANSVVYHKSEIHVKDNNPFPEPLNFVI